jgi:hypothetical protein
MSFQDPFTFQNQLKAHKRAPFLVPHPGFKPLKSTTGIPLRTPLDFILWGRPEGSLGNSSRAAAPSVPPLQSVARAALNPIGTGYKASGYSAAAPSVPPLQSAARAALNSVGTGYGASGYSADGSSAGSYYSHDSGWLAEKLEWIGEHVWPLPLLEQIGDTLECGEFGTRLVVGCIGGVLLLIAAWGHSATLSWVAAGVGGILGFAATSLIGKVVLFCNKALAFCILLSIGALIIAVTYVTVSFVYSKAAPKRPEPQYQHQQAAAPLPHHPKKARTASAPRSTQQSVITTTQQVADALASVEKAQASPATEQSPSNRETDIAVALSLAKKADAAGDEKTKWESYRRAAEMGSEDGIHMTCMYYGVNVMVHRVTSSASDALRWCNKGAGLGDPFSMYTLGTLYGVGIGVPKDAQQAIHWFKATAAAGDPHLAKDAQDALEHLGAH